MTSDDHVGNHIAGIGFGKSGTGAGVQAAYLGVRRTQGRFIATDSLLEPREFTTGKRAQVVKSDRECDFAFRTGRLLTKLYCQTLGEVPGTDACWVHVLDQFEGGKELLGLSLRRECGDLREFLQGLPKVTVFVERFDDQASHFEVPGI